MGKRNVFLVGGSAPAASDEMQIGPIGPPEWTIRKGSAAERAKAASAFELVNEIFADGGMSQM